MLLERIQRMNNVETKTFRILHYDHALANQIYCRNDVASDAHILLLRPELGRPLVGVVEPVVEAYSYLQCLDLCAVYPTIAYFLPH